MRNIILAFFLLSGTCAGGQTVVSNENKKATSLKKLDFIALSENNDSLIALVNLFFRKRNDANKAIWIGAGSLVLTPLIGAAAAIDAGLSGKNDPSAKTHAIVVAGVVMFYMASGIGIYYRIKYSRKTLLRLIQDFHSGKPLPNSWVVRLKERDFTVTNTL
ncbi:MAG: hypothetical protein KF856_12505 [Cyclobacteriaceae bacterium]|nr:hypothetical protein [Cyclobacteriaceae bacterium]